MSENIAWPKKTREFHSHHFDSTTWNDLRFRDDDIVIATYAKSGTTWMQQIIGQLLFGANPDIEVAEMSPWLDLRVPPKAVKLPLVEAQKHRRFLKTHLPVDALRFSPKAKYVYIGRDGRDVVWSMYNHHVNANDTWYAALNDTPGRVGPPIERPPSDIRQYWRDWMDRDGHPFWPFWENIRSWWQIRELPNVKFVHFTDMKRDLPGQIRGIAAFLDLPIDESCFAKVVEHCSFDWMKKNARKSVPLGGAFWDAGPEVFINKGVNGRWVDVLTTAESAEYEARARAERRRVCALAGDRLSLDEDCMMADPDVSAIAHVIQLSIAPVFLLTGIGGILGVMSNRLSRVIDRCRVLEADVDAGTARDPAATKRELAALAHRAVMISHAITSCTITALLICLVIVALFATAFFHFEAALAVAVLFIAAMLTFIFGLLSFLREVLLATKSRRRRLTSMTSDPR